MLVKNKFNSLMLIVFLGSISHTCLGDEIADAKAALEKNRLKASGTAVTFLAETEFSKAYEKAEDLKKALFKQSKEYNQYQLRLQQGNIQLTKLRAEMVQYNAALAQVQPGDVTSNNRIVGALNAIQGQVQLMEEERTRAEDQGKLLRAKLTEAREVYVQSIIDMRKQADQLSADYETKSNQADITTAVALVSKASKRDFTFGPSTLFNATLKKLKALEDTVLSESIPLDREGNTLRVSVVVNGNKAESMVLDSGATSISLPFKMAESLGVTPTESDPKVRVSLADGSVITGYRKMLASVRVGKFTVSNVECIVLGREAVNAEPLLGMSYLGNFKFEVNADAKTLTMLKVAGDEKQK